MLNTTQKDLFLLAGEPSGDLHGERLMTALRQLDPSIHIGGIGGPKMRAQGIKCLLPMEEFQLMGFTEILKNIPKIIKSFALVRDHILQHQPNMVIFIDYPEFNMLMAKSLRKKGYRGKLVHYICPSVWAWRKNRIHSLSKTLDLLVTIYPFEKKYFKNTPLNVVYAGHPSFEDLKASPYHPEWIKDSGINPDAPLLSIFPGSRKSIVLQDLPKQLQAAKKLLDESSRLQLALSIANLSLLPHVQNIISELGLNALINTKIFLVPEKYRYDLMQNSTASIATSGTVTLELALHQTPTVVVYAVTKFNAFLAKYIFRINLPYYSIVNILCEGPAFPELIHKDFTTENVYRHTKELLAPGNARDQCLLECGRLSSIFGPQEESASQKAAQSIFQLL